MDASFSHVTRAADLQAMASQPVDVLVVGNGLLGAAVARDAARRGIRTALINGGDFADAIGNRLPRPLHEGIPYLQHRNWHLTLETSKERRLLLQLAPHLVRPLELLLPLYEADPQPTWKAVAGIALYDLLALFRNVRSHRWLGKRAVLGREPDLRPQGLRGGARFWSAAAAETRLAIAVARGARAAGALVANHAKLVALDRAGDRVTGAQVLDEASGRTIFLRALRIVAVGGPRLEAVRRLDDPAALPLVELRRATSVVVPTQRLGHRGAMTLTSPIDGRMLNVVPWAHLCTIGTVEAPIARPSDSPHPTRADVLYLLRSANALFPSARLTMYDVISAWSAVEALPLESIDRPATVAYPSLAFEDRPSGLLAVIDTQLTRFRVVAEQVTDYLARSLVSIDGREPPGRCTTASAPLPGGEVADLDVFIRELSVAGAPPDLAAHLVSVYGTEAPALLKLIERDRQLGTQLVPGLPTVWAEVVHALRREMAMTVSDVLGGRTALLMRDPRHALPQAPQVARRLARELDWTPDREREAIDDYAELARGSVAFAAE